MEHFDTIALIPARAGSKGIPGKNKKLLAGKPLVQWTIEAALNAKSIDKTFVTTDDADVAEIANGLGVPVLVRPPELGQDHVQLDEVYTYALRQLQLDGVNPDTLVFLAPTSPLRNSSHIDDAVALFLESDYSTILSVCRDYRFHWAFDREGEDPSEGIPILHTPTLRLGRQWIPEDEWLFRENGAIYVQRKDIFSAFKCTRVPSFGLYVMGEYESPDIDTYADWAEAERRLEKMRGTQK